MPSDFLPLQVRLRLQTKELHGPLIVSYTNPPPHTHTHTLSWDSWVRGGCTYVVSAVSRPGPVPISMFVDQFDSIDPLESCIGKTICIEILASSHVIRTSYIAHSRRVSAFETFLKTQQPKSILPGLKDCLCKESCTNTAYRTTQHSVWQW